MNRVDRRLVTLVIHWPRFGPYHIARLDAAFRKLAQDSIRVVGFEIAKSDGLYEWREETEPTSFERYVVFPESSYDDIPWAKMWQRVYTALRVMDPDVLAINGYNSTDAWALLAWSRMHRRSAILMSESSAEDAPRGVVTESIKRAVVGKFSAALCGGTRHRAYLEQLGMDPERIFMGYDVVDNNYFQRESGRIRRDPDLVRHLPALAEQEPFFLASSRFIPRKNLGFLLQSYYLYRILVTRCSGKTPPWRLVILGDGEARCTLEAWVRDRGVEGVAFPGFRQIDELPAYYGRARAFIHPALQEQWGLVVNEAMAAGLPVLVSERCGCAPDLVRNGENGFTFDPEDAQALSNLMFRVASGELDLAKMGRSSQSLIEQWGPESFAQGMADSVAQALELPRMSER